MNKEQSADDPSVDLIRVKKICLIAPFLCDATDVVIACIEYSSVFGKHSEQLRHTEAIYTI